LYLFFRIKKKIKESKTGSSTRGKKKKGLEQQSSGAHAKAMRGLRERVGKDASLFVNFQYRGGGKMTGNGKTLGQTGKKKRGGGPGSLGVWGFGRGVQSVYYIRVYQIGGKKHISSMEVKGVLEQGKKFFMVLGVWTT